eukprot:TRINITY_DN10884_c0_g1_i1.p1 TRINITY_DN10884_c0_g1~~TRINITY_DN10884_c0_g1_i1.p1  ORF type:complete len:289 (+),score=74.54 TRINITY_DN10884_c0_g1_i1:41-907(+)
MAHNLRKFKLGLVQMMVGANKTENLLKAQNLIKHCVSKGADIVSLPECFNSTYATTEFPVNAELVPESKDLFNEECPSVKMLSEAAKENRIFLVGGSIPEKDEEGLVYNSSLIFNPEGDIIAKHRKMHLFNVDIPDGITFRESDSLSAGSNMTVFDTPFCKIGVAICYDMRFPQLSMLMKKAGAELLMFPAAFNTVTGPKHWDLLQRSRAVDNQCFVATASPALDESAGYHSYGHSGIVSPWGEIEEQLEFEEGCLIHEIDLSVVDSIREAIPIGYQAREDLYNLAWV